MPNTKQRSLNVFLCHAHSDKKAVRDLYLRLTQDGIDAWLDKEKLLPGQDWEYEIRKAVRKADVVVVCLSKQFNKAGFRQKEVRLALDTALEKPEGDIFIIPARLEECDTLDSLRHLHWVDLFEGDGYEKLKRSLHLRAEQVGAVLQGPAISKSVVKFDKQRDRTAQAGALNNVGVSYLEMGNYSKAVEYLKRSLQLSREVGDKKSEASILNNLGATYEKAGDLVGAVEFYEEAHQANREG